MLKLKSVNFEQQQFQMHQLDQSYAGQVEWMIGRNTTCDLVLSSPEVSREHGRIFYKDDAYHFVDIGSTSGSLLNGELINATDQRPLRPGDLLQIGETFLYVEETAPPAPVTFVPSLIPCDTLPLMGRQWTEGDLLCRCCRVIDEAPDVKTFCFVADPPVLFSYLPGQFVTIEVEIDGQLVRRPYSISSSPSRPWHLCLTVKRVGSPADRPDLPPGVVSNWLHDHLRVGDRVKLIGGPMGHFSCLPNLPAKMLLISAGSGITPMLSMSRWVQDTLADCDIVFLHSARYPEDIVFHSELQSMAAQMPNFHLAVTVTRPMSRPWMGLTGRISDSMLRMFAADLQERSVFVCGPEGFMQSVRSTLEAMQFPMQNYQEESFGGRKPAPSLKPVAQLDAKPNDQPQPATQLVPSSVAAYNGNGHHPEAAAVATATATVTDTATAPAVYFAQSGQEVPADDSASILELAEQEGVQIRNACRVGACGACKVLAREGKVRYDTPPTALSAADQEAGYVLACVACPVDRLVVEA
ncbi:MAG: hybrid-cluster NAD(P)-dependent oxidoreductase [Elainellaceae cyanobacterium]